MDFLTTLNWWQWTILGMVPPAIVALYFLKLKRQPLEVPSTYLWHKSIEDLRVNSLWQRIRTSLLLFLQLLFILLLIIALFRPNWQSSQAVDERMIFLIDNSASMQAVDVAPNRLTVAKLQIADMVEGMKSSDKAMLISFNDTARVEQSYTSNKQLLLDALERIQPSDHGTSLESALPLAAGLANPGRSGFENQDEQVAEAVPATMYIYSDGKFRDVSGFSLGNLKPVFVPVGESTAKNVGIVAFEVRRNEDRPDRLQAFARLENPNPDEAIVTTELYRDGRNIDLGSAKIPKENSAGVVFDLGDIDSGVLELRVTTRDMLAADNRAWAVINPPRPAKVLLVTAGNEPLERALATEGAAKLANVALAKPDVLKTPAHKKPAAGGAYDLIIYDNCRPDEMPRANTFFLGELPPTPLWTVDRQVTAPQIIDSDRNHPIMQWIDSNDIVIGEGFSIKPPAGSSRLLDSTKGLMFAVGPREGYEDAVLGFSFFAVNDAGDRLLNTNWHIRQSFPTFIFAMLEYLGGHHQQTAGQSVRPGGMFELHSEAVAKQLTVKSPSGRSFEVNRGARNLFSISHTDELGVYEVREGSKIIQRFTVNLFDTLESDIRPRAENSIKIGYVDIEGQTAMEPARFEAWKYLLLLALGVLLFEWYIYNRRVYL